jgi:hypothetical protein
VSGLPTTDPKGPPMHPAYAAAIAEALNDPATNYETLGVLAALGSIAADEGDEVEAETLDASAAPALSLLVRSGYLEQTDGYLTPAARFFGGSVGFAG